MICLGNSFRVGCGLVTYRSLLSSCKQNTPLYSSTAGLKSVEEKVGLPPKPKKPLTPYFRFMQQMRPTIKEENPKLDALSIVKLIAKKWEIADDATKKKLQQEFEKERMSYVEARAKYDSKVSPEQKDEMKQLRREKAEAKEKRETKKKVRELGKPKRPASAFLKFLAKERKLTPQASNTTYREWITKSTEKWARMSDSEKETYINENKKEMEIYKEELTKWEQKMVRLGNIDVVRNESLIDPPEPKPRRKPLRSE